MRNPLHFGGVAWLICTALLFAQSNPLSTEQKQDSNSHPQTPTRSAAGKASGAIEVLSDTMGVDFHPYLARVVRTVKQNWYNYIPQSAKSPLMRKGRVSLSFDILKDGHIRGMRLVETSGDVALDRGAWAGLSASNPFPPLPAEFQGQYLALSFHFEYNPSAEDLKAQGISSDKPADIVLSPASAQLVGGAKQQFSASEVGAAKSAVNWSLSCSAAACGSISADGLYTAPSNIPNSMVVTVIATLAADPIRTGSAIVTIQASTSR